MADLLLLSRAQMRRIERHFPRSHGVARVDDPADRERDRVCDQERTALARRTSRIRPAQDDLQPVRSLEPARDFQQNLRRVGGQGGHATTTDDRCDPS